MRAIPIESNHDSECSSQAQMSNYKLKDGGPTLVYTAGNATILVADDDEWNREILSEILTQEGYNVFCVEDGDRALEAIQHNRVDLALIDVMMPGKTGFDVCRAVKSHPETRFIPIVLVTGLTRVDERIQGITCGADEFLTKPINRQELVARTRSLLRIKEYTDELENAETVLFSMALSIEAKNPYTLGHCERLSDYSIALAERLGLPQEQLVALRRAGIVHDIGKIAVPDSILLKKGPLTADEWAIMKEHPIVGERICAPLKSFRLVLPIIRHHHEKLDGSGYPDGLKDEQIPLTARIMQVTDVYDALTTNRPYRACLTREQAFEIMREEVRRGWWDGYLVEELRALIIEQEG
jgi:putative two-component system response regulator